MTVLNELLDAGLRYAPEYRGGLSNHLPMALGALQGLGASEARLRRFFDTYVGRLSPAPGGAAPAQPWTEQLGRPEAYSALQAAMREAIRRDGRDATLRQVLPALWPGVGGAAFHGLIRTAYAVAAGHDGETAAALAYWACRHLPLGACEPVPPGSGLAPRAWLGQLADASAGAPAGGGLIFERMRQAAARPAHAALACRLTIAPDTLRELSALAMDRYLASADFTVLHLVTSCHALRLLLPHADDPTAALRWYAQAYAAAFVASGVTLSPAPAPAEPPGWQAVTERAIASDNDHVIKLVYSCREEASCYDPDTALRVAHRAVAPGA